MVLGVSCPKYTNIYMTYTYNVKYIYKTNLVAKEKNETTIRLKWAGTE